MSMSAIVKANFPRTTYDSTETSGDGFNYNRYEAYNQYNLMYNLSKDKDSESLSPLHQQEKGQSKTLEYIYDQVVRNLDRTVSSRKLETGERFEFEWAVRGLNNLVQFHAFEEHLLMLTKEKLASGQVKVEDDTYLTLATRGSIEHSDEFHTKGRDLYSTRLIIRGDREIRKVLTNLENISEVDKEAIRVQSKQRIYSSLDRLEHFNLNSRIAIESDLISLEEATYEILNNKKSLSYRLIRRQSFIFNNNYRIDLSTVKSGNNAENMIKSNETYEAELELNPTSLSNLDILRPIVVEGLHYLVPPNFLTKRQELMVKWDLYLKFSNDANFTTSDLKNPLRSIAEQWFSTAPDWSKQTDLRNLQSTVVNFESKHLRSIYGSDSYAITDKSDGGRNWLYINPVGDVFLVNTNIKVKLLYSRLPEFYSTILDGEYVETDDGYYYLIFDCLFINDKNYMSLPLLGDINNVNGRLVKNHELDNLSATLSEIGIKNEIKQFQKLQRPPNTTEVNAFLYKRNIIKSVAEENIRKPYETDGVIFTLWEPSYYQIISGGMYYNTANIKWKPEKHLSIDFLVKIQRDSSGNHIVISEEGQNFKGLDLFVQKEGQLVQKASIQVPVNINDQLRCWISSDKEGSGSGFNGDLIYDGTVIECLYGIGLEDEGYPKMNWIPMRFRPDKTFYERPNGEKTYNGVIESAKLSNLNQILPDLDKDKMTSLANTLNIARTPYLQTGRRDFFGECNITCPVRSNSIYRNLLNCNRMVKFNTLRQIIDRYKKVNGLRPDDSLKLLDLACGRCNDYDSWNCLLDVWGLDSDEACIRESQKFQSGLLKKHNDAKLTASFQQINLLTWNEPNNKANQEVISKLPLGQLDIVVCQFALHFFTKSQKDFMVFLELVQKSLKPGGILLISTFDGEVLEKILERDVAVGFLDQNLLWQITRSGPNIKTNESGIVEVNKDPIFGCAINSTIVPLTGYNTNKEYLVHFNDKSGQPGLHKYFEGNKFTKLAQIPFAQFLNDEQIEYYQRSQHTAKPETVEQINKEMKRVFDHPNLKVILDYHTLVCYQRQGGVTFSEKDEALFSGLDPTSPNVQLRCSPEVRLPGDRISRQRYDSETVDRKTHTSNRGTTRTQAPNRGTARTRVPGKGPHRDQRPRHGEN